MMMKLLNRVVAAAWAVDWRAVRGPAGFVLRRVFELMVIGPACLVLALVLAVQLWGVSPLRATAESFAEMGEGFRGAPVGYVSVPVMPVVHWNPRPPVAAAEVKALPRQLVPLGQWIDQQAQSLAGFYQSLVTVSFILGFFLVGFRVFVLSSWRTDGVR